MSDPADLPDRFRHSGLPNYIEYYRCFEDLSQAACVDGMEYWKNEERWDDVTKRKWRFFYRPLQEAVGRPQKELIQLHRAYIARRRNQLISTAIRMIILLALIALVVLPSGSLLSLVKTKIDQGQPGADPNAWSLGFLVAAAKTVGVVAVILSALFIRSAYKTIRLTARHREFIAALEREIKGLEEQCYESEDDEWIESMLRSEFQALERLLLSQAQGVGSDDPGLFDKMRHNRELFRHPFGLQTPLVYGWAPLQPRYMNTSGGKVSTGLERAVLKLGTNASTYRPGRTLPMLCRVWYLQFIFPLDRHIYAASLFYDFIEQERFGQRAEVFQYNHITNRSISEASIDLDQDFMRQLLPIEYLDRLRHYSFTTFSLTASSGSHFTCTLTDRAVETSLNEWFKAVRAEDADKETFGLDANTLASLSRKQLNRLREETTQARRMELISRSLRRKAIEASTQSALVQSVSMSIQHAIEAYAQHVKITGTAGSIL